MTCTESFNIASQMRNVERNKQKVLHHLFHFSLIHFREMYIKKKVRSPLQGSQDPPRKKQNFRNGGTAKMRIFDIFDIFGRIFWAFFAFF